MKINLTTMKRLLVALLLLMALAPLAAQKQKPMEYVDFQKDEITFSIGGHPTIGIFYNDKLLPTGDLLSHRYHSHYSGGKITYPWDLKSFLIGAFNFEYNHNFTRLHGFGCSGTYAFRDICYLKGLDHEGTRWDTITGKDHYLNLQVHYRITYKRYEILTLYCSVHVGATLYFQGCHYKDPTTASSFWACPAVHVTLLGMNIGKKNAVSIEIGVGTQGVCKIGYTYRF